MLIAAVSCRAVWLSVLTFCLCAVLFLYTGAEACILKADTMKALLLKTDSADIRFGVNHEVAGREFYNEISIVYKCLISLVVPSFKFGEYYLCDMS